MKICTTCVLPETFPGISFDEKGRCSFCTTYRGHENQQQLKERYKDKFAKVIQEKRNLGSYDALAAYSGGKDSTYTLMLLKNEFHLKVLAITFDHGFVSPAAFKNIRHVTSVLDMDHMTVKPGTQTLNAVFARS